MYRVIAIGYDPMLIYLFLLWLYMRLVPRTNAGDGNIRLQMKMAIITPLMSVFCGMKCLSGDRNCRH